MEAYPLLQHHQTTMAPYSSTALRQVCSCRLFVVNNVHSQRPPRPACSDGPEQGRTALLLAASLLHRGAALHHSGRDQRLELGKGRHSGSFVPAFRALQVLTDFFLTLKRKDNIIPGCGRLNLKLEWTTLLLSALLQIRITSLSEPRMVLLFARLFGNSKPL